MPLPELDQVIKIEKNKLKIYIIIATLLPIILLTLLFSTIYLNNIQKLNSNILKELKNTVLEERKKFIQDVITRTIYTIEKIRFDVKLTNKKNNLTQDELDTISKHKIKRHIRGLRPNNDNYVWVDEILNFEGGDKYAIRLVHPNKPETEGKYLSTNTEDIKGTRGLEIQLQGIKNSEKKEVYLEYFFKKLNSDKIRDKLSFVKLYEPFNWTIGTGIYLDDFNEFILSKETSLEKDYEYHKNISILISVLIIILAVFIINYFQYYIQKLIHSYETKIQVFTTQLTELAIKDQLTGLNNRLELDTVYEKELEKANRYEYQFSVIMIDLDHFKSVNDTYGHQVGDSVLKELATLLSSNIRKIDILGRWGGEEFLIICPHTDLIGASKLAENIRKNIADNPFDVIGTKTSSFGVSAYRKNDTQESMVERADNALYLAKESGRNCVKTEID